MFQLQYMGCIVNMLLHLDHSMMKLQADITVDYAVFRHSEWVIEVLNLFLIDVE